MTDTKAIRERIQIKERVNRERRYGARAAPITDMEVLDLCDEVDRLRAKARKVADALPNPNKLDSEELVEAVRQTILDWFGKPETVEDVARRILAVVKEELKG